MEKIGNYEFDTFLSPSELIDYAVEKFTTRPAVTFYHRDQKIQKTFFEFKKNIQQMAAYLTQTVQPKQQDPIKARICLIGEPSYEWLVSFYAVAYAGFAAVLIDCSLSSAEIIDHIERVESDYVLFDEKKMFCQNLTEYAAQHHIHLLRFCDFCGVFSEFAESAESFDRVKVLSDDVAVIAYTSGTTGKSKGVMLTNKNLMSSLSVSCYMARRKHTRHYTTLAVLPFHHMFQVNTGIQCALYYGLNICIGKGVKYFSQSLKEFKPSIVTLVPLAVELMHKNIWAGVRRSHKERPLRILMAVSNGLRCVGIDLRKKLFQTLRAELGGSLNTIIAGGAPLDDAIIKEFKTWGIDVLIGYGITECSPVVSCNRPEIVKKLSVGKPAPVPFYDVKIVDGEILVRGDIVMKGYYNDSQGTWEAFTDDGWFRTGDLGRLDKDGFVYITGRLKNLIILPNGENVSPEELENIFINIEGIKDVLISERTVNTGKVLTAIIVPEDHLKDLGETPLRGMFEPEFERLNVTLPAYKRVYRHEIRLEDFEKSSSLKIKRIKENYEPWKPKL
ncbi:MAG: AMP-binding protein [Peptococcaceae bacterium]|nr:AMP-binding protein [Peptococcaceae bacterium]